MEILYKFMNTFIFIECKVFKHLYEIANSFMYPLKVGLYYKRHKTTKKNNN